MLNKDFNYDEYYNKIKNKQKINDVLLKIFEKKFDVEY